MIVTVGTDIEHPGFIFLQVRDGDVMTQPIAIKLEKFHLPAVQKFVDELNAAFAVITEGKRP